VAPNGLQEIINLQLQIAGITLGFVIDYLVPTPGLDMPVLDEFRFDVRSFSLSHRVACFGYLLSEKPGERHLAVDKGMLPSLPYEAYRLLKAGRDFQDIDGKIYSHLDLTTGPDPIRQFAFFTDTNVQLHLAPYLLDCDLLYHDATFMDNLKEKAHETGHSTAIQAALFAKEAGVKKLILGHFSSRYGNLEPLRSEAQGVFPETYLAIEGKSFNINTIHK
jgi:ribonuclease Z